MMKITSITIVNILLFLPIFNRFVILFIPTQSLAKKSLLSIYVTLRHKHVIIMRTDQF